MKALLKQALKLFETLVAKAVPEDYAASSARTLNVIRSNPALTAEAMFRMVADGDRRKIYYYCGPDGEAIPRVKQLLGQDWWLEELSARNRGEETALWRSLIPRPAGAEIPETGN